MIIVKDEDTIEQAVVLVDAEGTVHYSDHYMFRTISSPEKLRVLCNEALSQGEIALVAPLGEDLPDWKETFKKVKVALRAEAEERAQEWIRTHPDEVEALRRQL